MNTSDLDQEYSPKAAARARAREAQKRRIESQRQYLDAQPIADTTELSAAVAQLAGTWGLKRAMDEKFSRPPNADAIFRSF